MDTSLQLRVLAALKDNLSGPLGKIKTSSAASAQGLASLRGNLKQLQSTQSTVGKFRELSRGLQSTRTEMTAAQQRVAALSRQMQGTVAPTRAMTREFNSAVRTAQQLKERHGQQSMALQKLRSDLSRAGVSTSSLARDEMQLRQRIDQTSQALNRQTAQLRTAAQQQQRLAAAKDKYQAGRAMVGKIAGVGAASMAAGGGVLYAAKRFMAPGMELEANMSRVQALTGLEKDSAGMRALTKQAEELGANTSFTSAQASEGQGFLAMAGFKENDILAAMPGMLSLAKAGNVELAATADIASNILTGMGLAADQMDMVGDVMTAAFTGSNTSVQMLGETMKYAAPVGALLGQDLQVMTAMAAKLGDAGIQSSMAGTSMKTIMSNLSSPVGRTAAALKKLGISTRDAKGNMRGMPEILEELYKKTSKMGTAQQAGFFKDIAGKEAFSALAILTARAGEGELKKFVQMLRESDGAAAKVAKTMSDNLRGDLTALGSIWEALGTEVYKNHSAGLREMVQQLTEVLKQVRTWMEANPETAKSITTVIGATAALVTGFGGLTLTLASILGPFVMLSYVISRTWIMMLKLKTGFLLAKAGVTLLHGAVMTRLTPLLVVLRYYLGKLSYGLTMLAVKSGGLSGIFARLAGGVGWVKAAFIALRAVIIANPIGAAITIIAAGAYVLYQYWQPISAFFSALWDAVCKAFGVAWDAIAGVLAGIWSDIKQAFGEGLAWVGGLSAKAFEFGGNLIQGLIDGIANMAGTVKSMITNVGSSVVSWFKEKLGINSPSTVFAEFGVNLMQGLINGIKSMASAVKGMITNMGSNVLGWFKDKLGIGGQEPAVAKTAKAVAASVAVSGAMAAPAFADGLTAAEAARFDTRPAVTASHAASAPRPVVVQGDTVTININGSGLSSAELQRAVEAALQRQQRDKAARLRAAYVDRR